jgi:hypothetical protein
MVTFQASGPPRKPANPTSQIQASPIIQRSAGPPRKPANPTPPAINSPPSNPPKPIPNHIKGA